MAYKPKKQLGQNFLIDKSVIEKMIVQGDITEKDLIFEIGPGQGSLTYALCKVAKKVIAIEKDEKLYNYLLNKFSEIQNVEFVNQDILEYLKTFSNIKKYKVVGNIPYYLTSHLIRELLELNNKPSDIILMVQKEVADRMIAKAGKMNLLAISVQIIARPEILFYVSKNSFWPKPKVDSAVIKLKVCKVCRVKNAEEFFKLVHVGFAAKRKVLANNLAKGLDISKDKIYDIFKVIGINENARAQDLSVESWLGIYKELDS